MRKVFVDRCNNGFAFPIVMSMVLMSLIASSIMIFKSVSYIYTIIYIYEYIDSKLHIILYY